MSFKANTLDKVVRVRPAVGETLNQRTYTVAASQDIKLYDIVELSSGAVQHACALDASNNTVTLSGGNSGTLGVAMASIVTNASGVEESTSRTTIPVVVLGPGTEILLRTYNSTAGDSEVQDTAIGTSYQFGRYRGDSASEWWYVASTTTTNGELRQIEKYPGQAVTDDYGLAWYRAIQSDTVQQA